MYEQVEKPKENKNKLVADSVTQQKSKGKQGFGFVDNRPESIAQRKDNKTGLPGNLKSGIENLSGYSMDDVRVHYNSDKPSQLHALAFAQGLDIHLASGQERHLPHEAWHVVQQKQGRVKPIMLMKGIGINDNDALEKEATSMGNKATSANIPQHKELKYSTSSVNSDVVLQPVWEWILGRISQFIGLEQMVEDMANAGMQGFTEAFLEMNPPPPPTFVNKVPNNLAVEAGKYLNRYKQTKDTADSAFIISYRANSVEFKNKILSGQKFLWTYDTDGYLSIGSPEMNQHSVVAAGKDVFSAGTGSLIISKDLESYKAYLYQVNVKAKEYREQGHNDIADQTIEDAKELFRSTPPETEEANDTVELDFESGHYAPNNAWKKTFEGWRPTGFKIVKSTKGGHI